MQVFHSLFMESAAFFFSVSTQLFYTQLYYIVYYKMNSLWYTTTTTFIHHKIFPRGFENVIVQKKGLFWVYIFETHWDARRKAHALQQPLEKVAEKTTNFFVLRIITTALPDKYHNLKKKHEIMHYLCIVEILYNKTFLS